MSSSFNADLFSRRPSRHHAKIEREQCIGGDRTELKHDSVRGIDKKYNRIIILDVKQHDVRSKNTVQTDKDPSIH